MVASWAARGWGVVLSGGRITHAIWADNIILFAASRGQLQQMVQELTQAMNSIGHSWKTQSLEYLLAAGSTVDLEFQLAVQVGDILQVYETVSVVKLLGDMFDSEGGTQCSSLPSAATD